MDSSLKAVSENWKNVAKPTTEIVADEFLTEIFSVLTISKVGRLKNYLPDVGSMISYSKTLLCTFGSNQMP